jgi:hypothetical protein
MDRNHVFISEYSRLRADAFFNAKLGIVANLKARRSLIEDYENLGFLAVKSVAELGNSICRDSHPNIEVQKQIAKRLSTTLKEHDHCETSSSRF